MTENYCKKCLWGDKCYADGGCEYFDPLAGENTEETILYNKTEYEYAWRDYLHHWRSDDKWGDIYE